MVPDTEELGSSVTVPATDSLTCEGNLISAPGASASGPPKNIFANGTNPAALLENSANGRAPRHHALRGHPRAPAAWTLSSAGSVDVILTTAHTEDELRDVFIFVEEDSELSIQTGQEPARASMKNPTSSSAKFWSKKTISPKTPWNAS